MKYKPLLFICLIFWLQGTFAAPVTCKGKVSQLTNEVPNGFYMKVADSGKMKVCNPEEITFSVTPQNCKHIASLASLAYLSGKDLTVIVEDTTGKTLCSEILDGYEADITYVGLDPVP